MYEKAKMYYDAGIWSEDTLRILVKKGKLTKTEFKEITGKAY